VFGDAPATSSLLGAEGGENVVLATDATPENQLILVIPPARSRMDGRRVSVTIAVNTGVLIMDFIAANFAYEPG
jgi:hypothetical protein